MATLNESLVTASKQLQAGRIDEAETVYRQIVSNHPDHVESIHNLGLIAFQRGDFEGATKSIQHAIKINANDPALHCNLGNVFQARGKLDEAVYSYRHALKLNPAFVSALLNLGNVLLELHRPDESVTCFLGALDLKPDSAEAHNFLGDALKAQSKIDKAIACYQKAIKLNPKYAHAFNNLGLVLTGQRRFEEATKCFLKTLEIHPGFVDALCNLANVAREQGQLEQSISLCSRAIELAPNFFEAHSNLGLAFLESGKSAEAIQCFQKSLSINPNSPEVMNNLGNAYRNRCDYDAAIEMYEKALRINPNYVEALCNYGIVLKDVGRFDDALAMYDRALQINSENSDAKFGKSVVLLLQGQWPQAWPLFESRWGTKDFANPKLEQPQWDGSDLHGKTILLTAEQGLGDTIQFVRYAKLVKEKGGYVILQGPPSLLELLKDVPGIDRCVSSNEPRPHSDVACSLMSLPGIFRTTVQTIPAGVPYLQANPKLVERWKSKLSAIDGFRVGICWQGNPSYRDDRERSLALQWFEPLAVVPGVQLISLQKGHGAEQLLDLDSFSVKDFSDEMDIESGPFMDTVAVMKNLDLVVSVDTVTAHLAGALGVEVWNLLAPVPHWPFLLATENTAWYPTMRLLRRSSDDRQGFLVQVAAELKKRIAR